MHNTLILRRIVVALKSKIRITCLEVGTLSRIGKLATTSPCPQSSSQT
jgi:hypothetical protein